MRIKFTEWDRQYIPASCTKAGCGDELFGTSSKVKWGMYSTHILGLV